MLEDFAAKYLISGVYALDPDPAYLRACFRAVALTFLSYNFLLLVYAGVGVWRLPMLSNRYLRTAFATTFVCLFPFSLGVEWMLRQWFWPAPPADPFRMAYVHSAPRLQLVFIVVVAVASLVAVVVRVKRKAQLPLIAGVAA